MKKLSAIIGLCLLFSSVYWAMNNEEVTPTELAKIPKSKATRFVASADTPAVITMEKQESAKPVQRRNYKKNSHPHKDKIIDRSAQFKKTKVGTNSMSTQVFWLKGQRLNIARNYRARSSRDYRTSMGRKISSINNHVIFEGKAGLPVIQDPVKKIKGIATGHIIVKAKPDTDLRELARKYKLRVHHTVPHLNLISFIPEDEDRLLETSASLAESELLEIVKLDISYGGPRAK